MPDLGWAGLGVDGWPGPGMYVSSRVRAEKDLLSVGVGLKAFVNCLGTRLSSICLLSVPQSGRLGSRVHASTPRRNRALKN